MVGAREGCSEGVVSTAGNKYPASPFPSISYSCLPLAGPPDSQRPASGHRGGQRRMGEGSRRTLENSQNDEGHTNEQQTLKEVTM